MPVYGRLSDQLGRKYLFIAGLAIFLAGSVIGGLAPNLAVLVTGRAVQGLGAGGLLILVQAVLADLVPARQRPRALAAVSAVFAAAAILGPPLGGWLVEVLGWRSIFWLNLPTGVAALALAAVALPTPRAATAPLQVDTVGIASLTAAVSGLVVLSSYAGTTDAWTSPPVLGLTAAVALAVLIFVRAERRAEQPLIPLPLFKNRNFTISTAAGLVMAVAMFGTITYLPTYLQMVHLLPPAQSGLVMLALVGGLGLATVASAQVVSRTGRYRSLPVVGAGLAAVGLLLLSRLDSDADLRVVAGALFVLGAGLGCALQILLLVVQVSVPPKVVGTATAGNDFFREIGVAVGVAAVGALFTSRLAFLLNQDGLATSGLDPAALTPERLRLLSVDVSTMVSLAYHDALSPVFGYLVPLMIISGVALAFLGPVALESAPVTRELETARA
jgi:EmrB/QacA subfamily drug resistance transporter